MSESSEDLLCTICQEPLKDGEETFCTVCKTMYVSLYASTGGALVERERGAKRWRTPKRELLISSRSITREEWEASGKKWQLTWEDEHKRIFELCHLTEVTTFPQLLSLLWQICDDKRGMMFPVHAIQTIIYVVHKHPECVDYYESIYNDYEEIIGHELCYYNPFVFLHKQHPSFGNWLLKYQTDLDVKTVVVDGKKKKVVNIDNILLRMVRFLSAKMGLS